MTAAQPAVIVDVATHRRTMTFSVLRYNADCRVQYLSRQYDGEWLWLRALSQGIPDVAYTIAGDLQRLRGALGLEPGGLSDFAVAVEYVTRAYLGRY